MDPVDEFARLKTGIRRLQGLADALRDGVPQPGTRLRSTRFAITIRRQKWRVCNRDRPSEAVLADPRHWDQRESEGVTCPVLTRTEDEDIVLLE